MTLQNLKKFQSEISKKNCIPETRSVELKQPNKRGALVMDIIAWYPAVHKKLIVYSITIHIVSNSWLQKTVHIKQKQSFPVRGQFFLVTPCEYDIVYYLLIN